MASRDMVANTLGKKGCGEGIGNGFMRVSTSSSNIIA